MIFNVQTSCDEDIEVLDTGNLVTEPNAVSREDVLEFADQVWGNIDSYNIINSTRIIQVTKLPVYIAHWVETLSIIITSHAIIKIIIIDSVA